MKNESDSQDQPSENQSTGDSSPDNKSLSEDSAKGESGLSIVILNWIERVGNKLPDPVTIFAIGALLVLLGSEAAVRFNWTEELPQSKEEIAQGVEAEKVAPISLLRKEGAQWVWSNMVTNFTGFAPLGVVLVAMIGIGVAERSGLLGTVLKGMVLFTPESLITPSLLFVGVMSSMALDAGYVVLPPLAAVIFARMGRAPLVGIAAAFAGVAAGFSANLLVTGLDPLLQGFTQTSARILEPEYEVSIPCNYFFMFVSTFMITVVGWVVTRYVVEPRFSKQQIDEQILAGSEATAEAEQTADGLSQEERRGLLAAGIAVLLTAGGLLSLVLVPDWPLSGKAANGLFPVWVTVIVPLIFVLFIVPGIVYGVVAGTIKSDRDVSSMMGKTMSSMGPYIVLAFFAGQFTAWFAHSNMGTLIAIRGVLILSELSMPTWLLVLSIVLLTAFLNLFIGSASGKWALIAPVFVPLFMGLGIDPEVTQAAYRVGDSFTNTIAPLNPYVIIILVFLRQYAPKAGMGTLVSLMLPYTLAFGVVWSLLLVIWFLTGLPLGF